MLFSLHVSDASADIPLTSSVLMLLLPQTSDSIISGVFMLIFLSLHELQSRSFNVAGSVSVLRFSLPEQSRFSSLVFSRSSCSIWFMKQSRTFRFGLLVKSSDFMAQLLHFRLSSFVHLLRSIPSIAVPMQSSAFSSVRCVQSIFASE